MVWASFTGWTLKPPVWRAPEWLAEPEVRDMVAGLSHAERHHGGEGALYVALKRPKPR